MKGLRLSNESSRHGWRGPLARILSRALTPGKTQYTAVDPGAGEIKMVQVDTAGGSPVVTAYGRYPAPVGDWTQPDNKNALVEALREVMRTANQPADGVITAMNGDRVITRHVRVPVMPDKELASAVQFEAEKYMTAPLEQLTVRYLNLGVVEAGGEKCLHLLLAAAPTAYIYDFYGIFAEAGLPVAAIDLPSLALWRVFCGLQPAGVPAGTVGIIDIGASATQFVVVRDRKLQLTRTLPVGGDLLTRSLAEQYGLDNTRARRLKEEKGVLLSVAQAASAGTDAMRLDLSLRDGLAGLVREVSRSYDYYAAREHIPAIERLIVSGGASKLKGFREFFAGAMGVPVDFGDPGVPGLPADGPAAGWFDPAFAVVLGLALREVVA